MDDHRCIVGYSTPPEKASLARVPPARQSQGKREHTMYFDRRLWVMMEGLRLRVAAAVGLGLIAMVVGILRFVCLGRVLALTRSEERRVGKECRARWWEWQVDRNRIG